MVKHCKHLLNKLKHNKEYQFLLDEYHKTDNSNKKAIGKQLNEYRASIGLSKSGLESYIKVWQKKHSNHISSHQAQKEAERVMLSVEKIIFGNGKEIHFRKLSQTTTLCSKSPKNGVAFGRENMTFRWIKDTFSLKPVDKNNLYMIQALYPNGKQPLPISYCEIKRMMFPNGWHYYLNIYIKSTAPFKHYVGAGKAGIDPGTSTMAVVTEHKAILRELAPKTNDYTKRLKNILRAMDKSRRDSNPLNYTSDGKVIKGCKLWNKSKRYKELECKYKSLCRQKALYIKQSHCVLANEVLEHANNIIVEHMDYSMLQRRSKNTEHHSEPVTIKNRKGKQQVIRKYKRKKRFGKSLASRAPAEFLTILKQKLDASGGEYNEVNTKKFKASQYDHSDNTYKKITLNTRFKIVDGIEVQRDLYSAFLIQHSNKDLDAPDRQACIMDFEIFVKLQNEEIQYLKASCQSKPECFGF